MSLPGDADIPSPVSTLHLAITIDEELTEQIRQR